MKAGISVIRLGIALVAVLGWGCLGVGPLAGGGGAETGNGSAIAGSILDTAGGPASGAILILRPRAYLQGSSPLPGRPESYRTLADAAGTFALSGIDTGDYLLEAELGKTQGLLQECRVDKPGSRLEIHGSLAPTGVIRGKLTAPGAAGGTVTIQVYGMERRAVADGDGSFVLDGMPQGIYTLRLASGEVTLQAVDIPKVAVKSQAEADIGQIELPPKGCGDYACDSLSVRAALDSNGLFAVRVSDVSLTGASLRRITEVNLAGRNLASLPAALGRLELLTKLDVSGNLLTTVPAALSAARNLRTLDLSGNRLAAVPAELGRLALLANLNLKRNALAELPPELGRLRSLAYLDLQDNLLRDIPAAFTALGPLLLAVDNNKLCALSPEMEAWIKANEPDYAATSQTCP